MTTCSPALTLFPLPKKPVIVTADGGALTSDAGVLLVQRVDQHLGLSAALARCLPDEREPAKVQHSLLALVRQRLYQICLGYEDANDANTLRFDPAFKLAVGKAPSAPDLASQPTLSRLEHRVGWHECWRMSEALLESYLQRHQASPPTRLVLDVDATDDPTHGQQELSFYHGFYETHCYLPLLVFAQAEGTGEQELLCAVLRPGNAHAGQRAMAILRRVVTRLRQAFPHCQVELRADSGLALPEIYDGCEALGLPYTISLPKNERLDALAQPWLQDALAIYEETAETVQVFGECCYAAHSWPHARRVIVKAEVMAQGVNLRFVATSDPTLSARERYVFYCQRGDPENRIKELKQGLAMDRLSCHRFPPQADFACSCTPPPTCSSSNCGRCWQGRNWRKRKWRRSGCACSRWERGCARACAGCGCNCPRPMERWPTGNALPRPPAESPRLTLTATDRTRGVGSARCTTSRRRLCAASHPHAPLSYSPPTLPLARSPPNQWLSAIKTKQAMCAHE
jgi:hypothetical protein